MPDLPPPPRRVTRRVALVGVLGGATAGLGTLASCGASGSSSAPAATPHVSVPGTAATPVPGGTGTPSPAAATPSNTEAESSTPAGASSTAGIPTWVQLSTRLLTSAGLFAGAATAGLKGGTPAVRTWAGAASRVVATQAAVLAHSNPLSGAAVTPATVTPQRFASQAAALAAIAKQQAALQQTFRNLAQNTTVGQEVLLLASLATSAHALAAAGPAPIASAKTPGEVDTGTRADALQVLVSHVEAALEGYEIGAGRLAATAPGVTLAKQRIPELWAMRDTAQAAIVQARATPSAPGVSFHMPGGLGTWATIRRTWGLLELDLLDAWARVAAASTGNDRALALTAMYAQADAVKARGVGLPTWPGWS